MNTLRFSSDSDASCKSVSPKYNPDRSAFGKLPAIFSGTTQTMPMNTNRRQSSDDFPFKKLSPSFGNAEFFSVFRFLFFLNLKRKANNAKEVNRQTTI